MDSDAIRAQLNYDITEGDCTLRDISHRTGVSPPTLCRFLKGAETSSRTFSRLRAWCLNSKKRKSPAITIKKFKVGSKEFVIEVREVLD